MITVVSGLPRSGTSLVMQMLAAGGLAVLGDELRRAGVELGKTYPLPLVDHGEARNLALAAFSQLKAPASGGPTPTTGPANETTPKR